MIHSPLILVESISTPKWTLLFPSTLSHNGVREGVGASSLTPSPPQITAKTLSKSFLIWAFLPSSVE